MSGAGVCVLFGHKPVEADGKPGQFVCSRCGRTLEPPKASFRDRIDTK